MGDGRGHPRLRRAPAWARCARPSWRRSAWRASARIFEALPRRRLTPSRTTTRSRWRTGRRRAATAALSEAMVNIRCTLARAAERRGDRRGDPARPRGERQGDLLPRSRLCDPPARDARTRCPRREIAALARWLPHGRVNQKRARRAGHARGHARLHRRRPAPAQANFTFERTTYWQSAEARFRSGGPTAPALLAALRLDASRCERVGEDELRAWYFARVAAPPVARGPGRLDAGGRLRRRGRFSPRGLCRVPRSRARGRGARGAGHRQASDDPADA